MNENLNLVEILKNVPKGTKLYSPIFGECEFIKIDSGCTYCIRVSTITRENHIIERGFDDNGVWAYNYTDSECMLFPSKDNRDWSTFYVEPEVKKWEDIKYIKGYYIDDKSAFLGCGTAVITSAIIALHVLIYKATDISALSIGFITCSEIIVIGGIFIIIGKDN